MDADDDFAQDLTRSTPVFSTPSKPTVKGIEAPDIRIPKTPQSGRNNQPPSPDAPDTDVHVFLRVRPLLPGEEKADFDIDGDAIIARPITKGDTGAKHYAERRFTFSKVFEEEAPQSTIFNDVAMPLLKKFTRGIDALLFAYGATSAGKTHTVKGSESDPGLLPRMVKLLLTQPAAKGTEKGLLVSCAEVYNERVHDLLGDDPTKCLRIGRDPMGYTTIKGLKEVELNSIENLNKAMKQIDQVRRSSSTAYNAHSSRSHCIFILKLIVIPLDRHTGQRTTDFSQIKCSRLCIVDLAGCERVSTTDPTDPKTVSEAGNINKSMLVLGRCIRQIRKVNSGVTTQIPFRESKLTELFRDFFEPGKRSTTCSIIINISPGIGQFDDTLFALQFAAHAVECHVRDKELVDDDFVDEEEELPEDGENPQYVTMREFKLAEMRIREEVALEMSEKVRKIQEDYRRQTEEIRAQSQQPYTQKLQPVLALKMQMESKARELEECKKQREFEKNRCQELQERYKNACERLEKVSSAYAELLQKNEAMEQNAQRIMDTTKSLHAKQLTVQAELEERAEEIDREYGKRVETLQRQLAALQSQQ